MTRRTFILAAALLAAVGIVIRLHNALSFPILTGYDGFAHFTYVWYLSATGRVPLPTAGWEFFQPPLYYALMAAVWNALAGHDPMQRLHVGVAVVAVASLVHALVVWAVVRRRQPDDRWAQLAALAFMLFLPVHLYSVGFLGNEGLTAVLASLSFGALVAHLHRTTWARSLLLGVLLGLAMVTKITALAVVVGAVVTLGLQGLVRRARGATVRHLAIVAGTMLVVAGWYYARNVEHYGTPFVMSRRELMLRIVEDGLPQARRSLAEYLLFDPMIFRRPMWPRGDGPAALRNAVWTGLYANTWYDGFGGWAVPRVTESEVSRRAGQALMLLGAGPTVVVLLGMAAAVGGFRRQSFDAVKVATLATLAPMLVIFVVGTRAVPIAAAVKATYLMPVTAAFGVAFGLGLERLRGRRVRALLGANLALAGALAVVVFWHGLLFDARAIRGTFPLGEASVANQSGVVAYAGGDRAAARASFSRAAADGLHLGEENLAVLAFEDGRPDTALHHVKRALRLQPTQSFGLAADRALYDRATRAEYVNLVALFEQARGHSARAARAAAAAVVLDPTLPEAHYHFALALLATRGPDPSPGAVGRARAVLAQAVALDPGFAEAASLRARLDWYVADCQAAPPPWWAAAPGTRRYPVETGPGAPHAASIGRRRYVAKAPDWLRNLGCGSRPRATTDAS